MRRSIDQSSDIDFKELLITIRVQHQDNERTPGRGHERTESKSFGRCILVHSSPELVEMGFDVRSVTLGTLFNTWERSAFHVDRQTCLNPPIHEDGGVSPLPVRFLRQELIDWTKSLALDQETQQ